MPQTIRFPEIADFLSSENRVFIAQNSEESKDELAEKLGISTSAVSDNKRSIKRSPLGKRHSAFTAVPNNLGEAVLGRYDQLNAELSHSREDVRAPFQDYLTTGKERKYFEKVPENRTHEDIYRSWYMEGSEGTWAYQKLENAGLVEANYLNSISPEDEVSLTKRGEAVKEFQEDVEVLILNYNPEQDRLMASD